MNAKSKRPSVFDLGSIMVKPATPATAPDRIEDVEPIPELRTEPAPTAPKAKDAKEPAPSEMFRTSHYFSRIVHRQLREIALHEDRKVADLINEGIDHVLSSRNYATAAEMRNKKR